MKMLFSLRLSLLALMMTTLALPAFAASKAEIDAKVSAAMTTFYEKVGGGRELANKASAILVFPNVVKAGFGIGGEYGEGSLLVNGSPIDYYRVASASIGFQLGAQVKTEIILFMVPEALDKFRRSSGWEAGIDGSVALVTLGAGGEVDTNTIRDPIIGFILSNKGLMYNLSFEGAKITRIKK